MLFVAVLGRILHVKGSMNTFAKNWIFKVHPTQTKTQEGRRQ